MSGWIRDLSSFAVSSQPAGGRPHHRHINFATPQRTGRQSPTPPWVRDLHFDLVGSIVASQKVGLQFKQPGVQRGHKINQRGSKDLLTGKECNNNILLNIHNRGGHSFVWIIHKLKNVRKHSFTHLITPNVFILGIRGTISTICSPGVHFQVQGLIHSNLKSN